MKKLLAAMFVCCAAIASAPCQNSLSSEVSARSRFLGVTVGEFPPPQGLSGYDDIPAASAALRFISASRALTGPTPLPSYEPRQFVTAGAPDGTIYEGYSGRFGDGEVLPGVESSSSNQNTLQHYDTHFGYGYNPSDVFIGKREGGKIRTSLFFRDVGSHDTAPYFFTIDSSGLVHLIVSDVNISDNNELNVYSVIGDPKSGKWTNAVMLDRRGFTSWSRPWSGVSGESVHLLWDWGDATYDKKNPNMGLFYVNWTSTGYGRKVRVIKGLIESYAAAADPKTGLLFVAASVGNKVYVAARTRDGKWSRPVELRPLKPTPYRSDVSVEAAKRGGGFIVRMSAEDPVERLVRLR